MALLEVRNLSVRFATVDGGTVCAVNDISLSVDRGEVLGIVGESGSGKSQTWLGVMGLLARNGRAAGSACFDGRELLGLSHAALNQLRGARMGMIFQDPMTALNPFLSVGRQMTEVLQRHRGMGRREAERVPGPTGEVGRTQGVDREGCRLGALGVVHGGPRGRVDDQVVSRRGRHALCGIGDVEVSPAQRGDLMAGGPQGGDEVATQHAGRACDEDPQRLGHRRRHRPSRA